MLLVLLVLLGNKINNMIKKNIHFHQVTAYVLWFNHHVERRHGPTTGVMVLFSDRA